MSFMPVIQLNHPRNNAEQPAFLSLGRIAYYGYHLNYNYFAKPA